MNITFFEQLSKALATERLDAFRGDDADEITSLSRYLLNMALCESLYSPLQFAEISLRNAVHAHLSSLFGSPEWYNCIQQDKLISWQWDEIKAAKENLLESGKKETPGGVVAELHFGFWTAFFNKKHARTGLGFSITSNIFAYASRTERDFSLMDRQWSYVRDLRNRVFHHERILHWTNLDAQHQMILKLVGWISPEMRELAEALDRYTAIRTAGLTPWIEKIRNHWPKS